MVDERVTVAGAPPARKPWNARRPPSPLRGVLEWVLILVGAVVVAFVIKTFLFQAFYIPSVSMEPTLKVRDRVIVNKLSYDFHDVHRGDIVVFKSPPGEDSTAVKDLIKRVIALPGETVEARDGQILINGQPLKEPYLENGVTTNQLEPQRVPTGHVWVMGDNRPNSKDSRFFGAISEDLIVGRAFVRVWPIPKLSLL
ncbi:MAG TPA: signal peptidase I [Acidimicrobiales bacterium]|nr:signal peptidase I [Acidimicrobiales bacterium]